MDVYSAILLMALIAAGVAVAALAAGWLLKGNSEARLYNIAQIAGFMGLFLAIFALIAHFQTGHRAGLTAAMRLSEFLLAHPAPLVAIAVGAACGWAAKLKRQREAADG